jgi:transcriptional regulator with GAF, ATPase, and Fis domain
MMVFPAFPRLVAVSGPVSGEVFALAGDMTFGRDAGNTFCLPDPALSRRHCMFVGTERAWTIRDLKSSNGTFVNGVQVSVHALEDGDRIRIGNSVLLFITSSASPAPAVDVVDIDIVAPTTRLALDDSAYLRSPGSTGSRTEHGLRALLLISAAIHSVRREADLHRQLLSLVAEVIPAAGAAIVLQRPDGGLEVVEGGANACPGPLAVSRTVILRAIEERTGVLMRDGASLTQHSPSLSSGNVRSLLCAPIAVREQAFGALYLASLAPDAFDDDHLQLLTAIARIAAVALENVRQLAALEREADRLHADLTLQHNLVGNSAPMQRVFARLARVARTDATALITGETGTGKELVARAIHLNGVRARRPFVAVNCAALSESLLESDLFGHERGAFTGAITQKKGRVELADGGTLFLDEIGELAPGLQAKLLRVLQEREFERVGGTRPIKVDVRLISATNRNLDEQARSGRFRQDLLFRLNVVTIDMPPLRERRSDIAILAHHFITRTATRAGRQVWDLSPAARACLEAYDWPGNVRELENAIEHAAVLGTTPELLPEDLPEHIVHAAFAPHGATGQATFHNTVVEAKKAAIVQAFRAAGGSYTEAARLLGIHPNYLHRVVKNLGIKAALRGES